MNKWNIKLKIKVILKDYNDDLRNKFINNMFIILKYFL